ncbi:hypothetical protein B0H19DRAFT_1277643 [Mycena capillaripes]|nr:hypothetical protein B0H19DRAFT_1277643 [Mycena capillaripes]
MAGVTAERIWAYTRVYASSHSPSSPRSVKLALDLPCDYKPAAHNPASRKLKHCKRPTTPTHSLPRWRARQNDQYHHPLLRPPPICRTACLGLSLPYHCPHSAWRRAEGASGTTSAITTRVRAPIDSTAPHPYCPPRIVPSPCTEFTHNPPRVRVSHPITSGPATPHLPLGRTVRPSPHAVPQPPPDSFARSAHHSHELHVPRSYHIYTLPSPTSSSPSTLIAPSAADGRTRSLPAPPESAARSRLCAPFGTFEVCGSCIRWTGDRVLQKRSSSLRFGNHLFHGWNNELEKFYTRNSFSTTRAPRPASLWLLLPRALYHSWILFLRNLCFFK